jgi:predicted  nucleic acid-binding Zn-ribbon protein
MKREDVKKLLGDSVADDVIDKIMAEHGRDIEKHKTDIGTVTTERDGLKAQLEEANKQMESFKGMDIEGVKKSADDWKAKAEQAAKDAESQVSKLKFDHALESALTGAKAKNPVAVRALLKEADLKLGEDGQIVGLKEQLEKVKADNDYLFESDEPDPKIVAPGNTKVTITDPVIMAARKAAGLETNS